MSDKKDKDIVEEEKLQDTTSDKQEPKKDKKKKKIVKRQKDKFPLYDWAWRILEFGLTIFLLQRFY